MVLPLIMPDIVLTGIVLQIPCTVMLRAEYVDQLANQLHALKTVEEQKAVLKSLPFNYDPYRVGDRIELAVSRNEKICIGRYELVRLKADGSNTEVYFMSMLGLKMVVVTKKMKELEELFAPFGIVKIHKSHCVMPEFVNGCKSINNSKILRLRTNEYIPASRNMKLHISYFIND